MIAFSSRAKIQIPELIIEKLKRVTSTIDETPVTPETKVVPFKSHSEWTSAQSMEQP